MKMMMKKIMTPFLICIIATAVTVTPAAVFAGDDIVCPPRLTVQHEIIQDIPDGWHKHDDRSGHPFMDVMFTEGSPDLQIILAPAAKREVKGELIAEWEFSGSTDEYRVNISKGQVMDRPLFYVACIGHTWLHPASLHLRIMTASDQPLKISGSNSGFFKG